MREEAYEESTNNCAVTYLRAPRNKQPQPYVGNARITTEMNAFWSALCSHEDTHAFRARGRKYGARPLGGPRCQVAGDLDGL